MSKTEAKQVLKRLSKMASKGKPFTEFDQMQGRIATAVLNRGQG